MVTLDEQVTPVGDIDTNAILTADEQRYVDRYTLAKRRDRESYTQRVPLRTQFRRGLEAVNRNFWYGVMRRTLRNVPASRRLPIDQVRSVFVAPIGPAIGDMVVALSAIHTIQRRNPECRVGTFVSQRSKALIRFDHAVAQQYYYQDRTDLRHYPELFRARKDGYDVTIDMILNRMTEGGIVCNVVGGNGLKVCTSHSRKDKYELLFNHMLPFDRNSMHLSQLALLMLESVIDFGSPLQQWESRPTVVVPDLVRKAVRSRIKESLDSLGADWFVYFNPQARNPTREWGLDNTIEFAKRFTSYYDRGALLLTASPVQREEVQERIASAGLNRVAFFPTSYDLLEVAALAEESALVVTPDTSVIHFGTASGKPTLVLWSDPDFLPMEWIPLQVPSLNLCPEKRGMLVPTIPVDTVWEAARRLIDGEWTRTATSYGLEPESDVLYQAALPGVTLQEIVSKSAIPCIYRA